MNRQRQANVDSWSLLPDSFHRQQRVRQIRRSWITVVTVLGALFCVAVAKSVLDSRHADERNRQLATAALRLQGLRDEAMALRAQNHRQDELFQSVQSARPQDNVLQTLAAIAFASHSPEDPILIDSVEIRVPVEMNPAADNPRGNPPHLEIHARTSSEGQHITWLERLHDADRIDRLEASVSPIGSDVSSVGFNNAAIDREQTVGRGGPQSVRVILKGQPMATRVTP